MKTAIIEIQPTLVSVPAEIEMAGWNYVVVNSKTGEVKFDKTVDSKSISVPLEDGYYRVTCAAEAVDGSLIGQQLSEEFTIAPDKIIMQGVGSLSVTVAEVAPA